MKKLIYIISVVTLLLSNTASPYANFGFTSVLEQINNSFAVGIEAMRFNYWENSREADPDMPGNIEDYGMAYGINFNFRNIFYEDLYTELTGEHATGRIKYGGYKEHFSGIKRSVYKKAQHFANVDLKLGAILLDTEYFQLIPYSGFGFHYWRESSVHSYHNFKVMVGGRVNIALFDELVLSPYFNFGKTLLGYANAKSYKEGFDGKSIFLGKFKHKLGNKPIREMGLEISYRIDHEIFITGLVSYTRFEYGKSTWQYSGGYKSIEPNSKTNELRFGIGIRYGFV